MARPKWISSLLSLCVILSVASLSTIAHAAGLGRVGHSQVHAAKRCAKRNAQRGLVKISDWEFPETLNPAQGGIVVDGWVGNALFESLFQYDNHAHLAPQMATVLPTVKNGGIKNGGRLFIVHLKQGMRWSDGREITAQDVEFSWKAAMDPNAGGYCATFCDNIARIDTQGKYTLFFHMKSTFAPAIPYAISYFPLIPQSWPGAWSKGDVSAAAKELYLQQTFNYENPNFPTNGAYQVTQFINNDRIVMQPMKYYSTAGCGARLKELIFAAYSSKPGMIAAAASRQVDVTSDYTPADVATLVSHKAAFKTVVVPSFTFEHLEFNVDASFNGHPNPLSNTNVRLALALALDKIGLIRSALGTSAAAARGLAAWTFLVNTPTFQQPFADKAIQGQWDPVAKKYLIPGSGQALRDAKKLLDATPYKGGFTLAFYTTSGNPTRSAAASVIQANWARIGVTVDVNAVPASKLFAQNWADNGVLDHGQFQVGMFAYQGRPDPAEYSNYLLTKFCDRKATVHVATNANQTCMSDPLIDRAMTAASHTFSTKQRTAAYKQVQVEMSKKVFWLGLYYRSQITTTDNRVTPFSENPTTSGSTWNVYSWRLKST